MTDVKISKEAADAIEAKINNNFKTRLSDSTQRIQDVCEIIDSLTEPAAPVLKYSAGRHLWFKGDAICHTQWVDIKGINTEITPETPYLIVLDNGHERWVAEDTLLEKEPEPEPNFDINKIRKAFKNLCPLTCSRLLKGSEHIIYDKEPESEKKELPDEIWIHSAHKRKWYDYELLDGAKYYRSCDAVPVDKKEPEPEFKVGDWICRIMSGGEVKRDYQNTFPKQITEVEYDVCWFIDEEGREVCRDKEYIRLATAEDWAVEIPKGFKWLANYAHGILHLYCNGFMFVSSLTVHEDKIKAFCEIAQIPIKPEEE